MNKVLLDHGAGGAASRDLVKKIFIKYLGNSVLNTLDDAAVVDMPEGRLAISTDSFVVDPIFFPGGNIGFLSVHGTVNDLICRGAKPLWLSAGFILEEGLDLEVLERIVFSMAKAAKEAEVIVVTGDTKVVGRGQVDKIFINTSGVGVVPFGVEIGANKAKVGDVVLLSGTVGDHGVTIMTQREELGLEVSLKSDSASLTKMGLELVKSCSKLHVLRDPTRGGISTAFNEIAMSSGVRLELEEENIPVDLTVKSVSDLLGLDPFNLANEGKLIVIVDESQSLKALEIMKKYVEGEKAAIIGKVVKMGSKGKVWLKTKIGGKRILGMLSGESLPRIC